MTRRDFLAVSAAAGVSVVWLEAVVAPRLPHRIAVSAPAISADGALYELRTYKNSQVAAEVWCRLSACGGLSTRLPDPRTLLIPFESLTARDQTWRKLQAGPEWQQIRDRADTSYQFSIYTRKSSPR